MNTNPCPRQDCANPSSVAGPAPHHSVFALTLENSLLQGSNPIPHLGSSSRTLASNSGGVQKLWSLMRHHYACLIPTFRTPCLPFVPSYTPRSPGWVGWHEYC